MKGKNNWDQEEVEKRLEFLDILTLNYFENHFLRSWESNSERLKIFPEGHDDFLTEKSLEEHADYSFAMYTLCVNAGDKRKNAIFGTGPKPEHYYPPKFSH